MILNPPLVLNNGTKVTAINDKLNIIHFTIHFAGTKDEIQTLEAQAFVTTQVKSAVKYLQTENFITEEPINWKMEIAIILQTPK